MDTTRGVRIRTTTRCDQTEAETYRTRTGAAGAAKEAVSLVVVPHGLDLLLAGSTHASGNRGAVLVGLVGGVAVLPLVLHPSNVRSASRFYLAILAS
jgi:hypothetical protein